MEELQNLIAQAEQMARNGLFGDEAIYLNRRILEIDDRTEGAYTRLAKCFMVSEHYLAAREMYQQVLAFNRKNTIAINGLERAEQALWAEEEKKRVAQARQHSDEEQERADAERIEHLDDYDVLFAIGVAYSRRQKKGLAVAALSKAVALKPTKYALTALAAAYRHCGDFAQAHATLDQMSQDERDCTSQVVRAAIYRCEGKLLTARRTYQAVLELTPTNVYALNGLGGVLMDVGECDEAEKCFRKAAEFPQARDESIDNLKKLRGAYLAQGNAAGAARVARVLKELVGRIDA